MSTILVTAEIFSMYSFIYMSIPLSVRQAKEENPNCIDIPYRKINLMNTYLKMMGKNNKNFITIIEY